MKLNYRRKVCTADMNPYPCSLIEKGRIYGKHIPQFSLSLSLIKLGFSLYPDIYISIYRPCVFLNTIDSSKGVSYTSCKCRSYFLSALGYVITPPFLQYCDRLSNRDGYKP